MKKLLFAITILIFVFILYNNLPYINTCIVNNISTPTIKQNDQKQQISPPNSHPDDATCLKNAITVGHLVVPDTIINCDVIRTIDNEYFRTHDYDGKLTTDKHGKVKSAGAIYMDCRNKGDGVDKNAIIYGHNMKNGQGFYELMFYKENKFFQEHRYIYYGINKMKKWEVFSAYVTPTSFYYIQTDFKSNKDYMSFLNTIKGKSKFTSNVQLSANDHILTLSTCSYEFYDARFVVHARLVAK